MNNLETTTKLQMAIDALYHTLDQLERLNDAINAMPPEVAPTEVVPEVAQQTMFPPVSVKRQVRRPNISLRLAEYIIANYPFPNRPFDVHDVRSWLRGFPEHIHDATGKDASNIVRALQRLTIAGCLVSDADDNQPHRTSTRYRYIGRDPRIPLGMVNVPAHRTA